MDDSSRLPRACPFCENDRIAGRPVGECSTDRATDRQARDAIINSVARAREADEACACPSRACARPPSVRINYVQRGGIHGAHIQIHVFILAGRCCAAAAAAEVGFWGSEI